MDAKKLVDLRKEAEAAVAEMPDGDLKVKAFEVILAHLLGAGVAVQEKSSRAPKEAKSKGGRGSADDKSTVGRILVLGDEGFFKNQRAIAEVREELQAHGWHYPVTSLSPTLLSMVQKRLLRRERVKEGNKKVWKYSNP